MTIRLCLIVALSSGFLFGQNLLTNGDFEQDLSNGWTQTQGGGGYHTVMRGTAYHPDSDNEVYTQQYDGSGYTKLYQVVDVTTVDLELSFWAKYALGGGSSVCWPVSSVDVEYYNSGGMLLGDTRFYYHNAYCNWRQAGNRSLYDVADPDWMLYTLNIRQEIDDNLPSINPSEVARIGVALYDYTSGG